MMIDIVPKFFFSNTPVYYLKFPAHYLKVKVMDLEIFNGKVFLKFFFGGTAFSIFWEYCVQLAPKLEVGLKFLLDD